MVEDAGADEDVDRIFCDRHGEDVPLSEVNIVETEALFESLSQFQRWQTHIDANHRARLDEAEEVRHLPRAAADFEHGCHWGYCLVDPEPEGALPRLIHEDAGIVDAVVAGERMSFIECLHRLSHVLFLDGCCRRQKKVDSVFCAVAMVLFAEEGSSLCLERQLVDGATEKRERNRHKFHERIHSIVEESPVVLLCLPWLSVDCSGR